MAKSLIIAGLVITACVWFGCATYSPSQYVAPRIMGRVLDMETHQPLENVQVRRVDSDSSAHSSEPQKGGRALEGANSVRTGSDGTFELASERTLAVFRGYGWYSVSLAIERAGYQTLLRSYTLANATNTPSGEPLIRAGDILLPRKSK